MDHTTVHWLGYLGTALVIFAYFPQIFRLLSTRCSTGVSIRAYVLWGIASSLLFAHAITIGSPVFILLTGFQIIETLLIAFLAWKFRDVRDPQQAPAFSAPLQSEKSQDLIPD